MAGLAAAMGFETALTLGVMIWSALRGRRAPASGAVAPQPSYAEPSPLDQFAGPVVSSVPVAPAPSSYAPSSYAPPPQDSGGKVPWGGVVPVTPTTPAPDVAAQYDRSAQYGYSPPQQQYDASSYGYDAITPIAPTTYTPSSSGFEGVKPPDATTQYVYGGPAPEDARARAARELALHLAMPRSQWNRSLIRGWQGQLGVRVDGLIGPETRGAMQRYGSYVTQDKWE